MGRLVLTLVVVLGAVPATRAQPQQATPLETVLDVIDTAVADRSPVAVLRPEATGTNRGLSGLAKAAYEHLATGGSRTVIPADEVFRKAGPEFALTPEGIASVATRVDARAALFLRVFATPDQTELHVLLVDADGAALLDKSFVVEDLPWDEQPQPPPAPAHAAPESTGAQTPVPAGQAPAVQPPAAPSPAAAPPASPAPASPGREELLESYRDNALALVPRRRVVGGGAIGIAGGRIAVGIHTPAVVTSDWMIVEGGRPISELRLAEITGEQAILARMKENIDSMKTLRNVGIGMTLGGFIGAGAAFPFFKSEGDDRITIASVVVGAGLAVGATGLALWILYGPEAARATTPYPAHHLITRDEAARMIESYNRALRRELDISVKGTRREQAPPVRFGVFPDPRGGASAALQFVF